MSALTTVLRVGDLPPRRVLELRQKAKRMGLTAEGYVKQLIEDDLALDRKAKTTSLDKLAAPFRKALAGTSDEQLDRIVENGRRQKRSRSKGR